MALGFLARLEPLLTENRRPVGFTTGRSTADGILALHLLFDLHREFNQPLHVAYVDLKSALDSVDRVALWKSLQGIGVSSMLLNVSKDLNTQTDPQICLGKKLSTSFQTTSGVGQGCILAPALFCRAMDFIMACAIYQRGIMLSGDNFSDADYADDVATMQYDPTDIEGLWKILRLPALSSFCTYLWLKPKFRI